MENGVFISKTDASLSHLSVFQEQIINIINNFNPNKSHGHDGVSVSVWYLLYMLNVCVCSPVISAQ